MDERLRHALVAAWHACPEEDRHPPAAEDDLRAFEAEFGPIPPAFREYLAVCGGRVGGRGDWIDGLPDLPDSHHRFHADNGFWAMRGVFVVGWDGGGNPVGIEWSSGRVLVDDHDFGGTHELASSFPLLLPPAAAAAAPAPGTHELASSFPLLLAHRLGLEADPRTVPAAGREQPFTTTAN